MRRLLPALLAILFLSGTLVVAGPTQEFKSHGFQWTLPSDEWTFIPTSKDDENAGFVAHVKCTAANIEVWAYVKGAADLSLEERVKELAEQGGGGLGTPTATKVLDSTVSGVKGRVVIQKIKADGGVEGHFRKYAILSRGRFYHLLFRCWHGAHLSMTDEINAARRGFRLLKGAGGEDEDETLDEVEGSGKSSGGAGDGGGTSSGGHGDGDWPANGPKREGRKVLIHERNMEWDLPEASKFQWAGATEDVKQEAGRFVWAMAKVEREKKEFEKDTPDHNFCRLDLLIQAASPGWKAVDWMKGGHAQKQVEESKMLEGINSGKTRTGETKLGNLEGVSWCKFEGKNSGQNAVVIMFATVLRGHLYIVRALCWGHTDAYQQMAPLVAKAIRGIRFLETKEPVRGPLLGMVPDFAGARGDDADKEKDITGPGYTFEKPVGLSRIEVKDSMNRDLRFVGEGRSEDGEHYIYFEIRSFKLNIPNQPNPDPEKFIEKRAQDWEAGAGKEADLGSKSGLKIKKGSFGTAKGLSYRFGGHLEDVPYVEEGWVVKHKSVLLWFKMQYGGPDAEKDNEIKKLAKTIKKAVKFTK